MTTEHTHQWTPGEPGWFACTDCQAETPACTTCRRPTTTSLLICPACLAAERRVLDDIDHALALYVPTPPTPLRAVRYDRDRLTGTPTRTDNPTAITGPVDVLEVLDSWETAWRDTSGASSDLRGLLLWAGQNPEISGWEDYRTEARTLRHHARRLAGLLPAKVPAPCVHCAGTVVQDWTDPHWNPNTDGLSDTLRCTGCGTTWGNRERLTTAVVEAKIATETPNPDAHVTEAQARRLLPLGTSTIRQWVNRAKLTPAGRDASGRKTYRVGDLQELAAAFVDVRG